MFVQMFVIFLHFLFDSCLPVINNELDHVGPCLKLDLDIYFKFDLLCVFKNDCDICVSHPLLKTEACVLLIKHRDLVKY